MKDRSVFPTVADGPAPLRHAIERRVRFNEVDMMRVAWHGRYVDYCEEARVELGRQYGISYADFITHGFAAPIYVMHLEHVRPVVFDERITIEAVLHYSPAARINMAFEVFCEDGRLATRGYSIQLMMDRDMELMLIPPDFYKDFLDRWLAGDFS